MKYVQILAAVILLIAGQQSFAQEKVFEFVDKDIYLSDVELLGTTNDDLIIHYLNSSKPSANTLRVHSSVLLFPSAEPKRIALPYPLTINGVGYTDDSFFIISTQRAGREEDPHGRVSVTKVDKASKTVKQNFELKLDGESERFIFCEGNANYVITSAKKPDRLRIRRIIGLNIELFDFLLTKELSKVWSSDAVFVPMNQTEPIAADINRKVFVRNDKVLIALRNPKASGNAAVLTLYEFPLASPSSITPRPVALPGTMERLAFAPFGDRLFVYTTQDQSAWIHVLDLNTLQVLKSFSTGEPNSPMLVGDLVKAGGFGRNNEKKLDGEGTTERKLELITRLRPWIQVWPLDNGQINVSFGDYTMVGELKQFIYLNMALNASTLEVSGPPSMSRRLTLLEFVNGKRRLTNDRVSSYYTANNCYMLEFDDSSEGFTIWK